MPSASISSASDRTLTASQTTLQTLINHCRSSLNSSSSVPPATLNSPLDILHDTATLLKAHTTRISIASRPPESPEIAIRFISELSATVVPSLTTAATALQNTIHGKTLCKEAKRAVDSLLRELGEFIHGISVQGDAETRGSGRGRLIDTGVVWGAADRVISLKAGGAAGAVDRIVEECVDIMKDAERELKDWLEDAINESDAEEDEKFSDDEDPEDDGLRDWTGKSAKKLEPEMKECVEKSLKRIKLVGILFSATRKRRLALGAGGRLGSDIKRLDQIAETSKALEGLADELSMAYMEGEDEDSKRLHRDFENKAAQLAELLAMDDNGAEDKFTPWFQNCRKAILDSI